MPKKPDALLPKNTLRLLLDSALAADRAWQSTLVDAFGADACNRRYDSDKSAHPEACRLARDAFNAAQKAWKTEWDKTHPRIYPAGDPA